MRLPTIVTASLLAITVAGCGGLPDGTVATVGDRSITEQQFRHWLTIGVASQREKATDPLALPDPPSFERCARAKLRVASKPAKGQPQPTPASLADECEREYAGQLDAALGFLVNALWLEQEAERQGVRLTDAEVRTAYEAQRTREFPTDEALRSFLTRTKTTEADLRYRVRSSLLGQRLQERIGRQAREVGEADLRAYFQRKRSDYDQPERRDLRVVLAKDRTQALAARRLLASGASWRTVVQRYSIDKASRRSNGLLRDQTRDRSERGLGTAAFSARARTLSDPVESIFGWYVFEVERIRPAVRAQYGTMRERIRSDYVAERTRTLSKRFEEEFTGRWRQRTECAPDYRIELCDNAPEPQSTLPGQPTG